MDLSKVSLFLSGLFFGGAVDHAILASRGRRNTPYGYEIGVPGNWLMAAVDLAAAVALYWLHTGRKPGGAR